MVYFGSDSSPPCISMELSSTELLRISCFKMEEPAFGPQSTQTTLYLHINPRTRSINSIRIHRKCCTEKLFWCAMYVQDGAVEPSNLMFINVVSPSQLLLGVQRSVTLTSWGKERESDGAASPSSFLLHAA